MSVLDKFVERARNVARRYGYNSSASVERFAISVANIPSSEKLQTDLHRAFYESSGRVIHKWRHYLSVYDRHLSRFRNRPVRLLEIGVFRGGSLYMWRRYFGEKAIIFGIDVDPRCLTLNGIDGQVRIGSQDDQGFLNKVIVEMGGVDIIVDDGSHIADHQRASFEILFPILHPEGIYICEDLHTSYWWGHYRGGFRRRGSFIELVKTLIDDMHADFHQRKQTLLGAHRSIDGIHFYNSIVVIEKKPQENPANIQLGHI